MSEVLTQQDCELRMYWGGIKRAEGMMQRAEEKGRAVTNPYATELVRDYVIPVSMAIEAELKIVAAGQAKAHRALLSGLDPDAVAFLAVRSAVNALMAKSERTHHDVGYAIGSTIHSEMVLVQLADFMPELYHTLTVDFGRRLSKSERHRMTVFKMQAEKAGVKVTQWPVGARQQVGFYLLGLLQVAGLVDIDPETRVKHQGVMKSQGRKVHLSHSVLSRIDEIKQHVSITMPTYGPCVEPPLDWTTPIDGGFHTRELKRTHPCVVRGRRAYGEYRTAHMPRVLEAINTLQRTAWQVNTEVLDIVLEAAKHFSVGDITSPNDNTRPPKPEWLQPEQDPTNLPEDQAKEFKQWKRSMAEWYTSRKLQGSKYSRFYSATRAAEMFRTQPQLFFVYFSDTRGRFYPMTYGLSPQGSDLQRALLRFSKGLPLASPESVRWFHVQGANKWGFDKATLEERQQWVVDRQDLLLSFARDPIGNKGWTEADKPLQFLAWCLEYRRWVEDTTNSFVSYLPISMDGSCNGLQNLSALLRDEVGGYATNLTNNAEMQDIYRLVAQAAMKRMANMKCEDGVSDALRLRWLAHGIERSVVKRSVMTTPYGVTKRTATDYVVSDYLKHGKAPCFEPWEYAKAAMVLMDAVWPAIGDIVVKGRQAMDWLKKSARQIMKVADPDEPCIRWTSPSGFPAMQAYFELKVHRVRTHLHGECKIRAVQEDDEADLSQHVNGLAPNFVHSMDAAHLHLTTVACARAGIDSLAMIHDDYGTHAANAQKLFELIRSSFVTMYETCDPIGDFEIRYPEAPAAPARGTLNIRDVLDSDFFFS